ncbi:MAG: HEAT repeat domain-containing protein [Anaerolineae bacterium]|nr:HEAT repeat domain-containing protein [Anaerolineae bacterium]MDW8099115.1 HEAT repeat domain-containing protein [Anaerolineae bacterium]
MKTKVDIQTVLARLADPEKRPSLSILYSLSDLGREEVLRFQATWSELPVARRRWIARNLVELAEEHVELYYNPLFRWLLGDPDPVVRVQAIEGLWEDENVNLIHPLVRMLREDPDESVRAAAASALGRFVLLGELGEIDGPMAMMAEKALLATIHTPQESLEVRRRAVEAIAYSSEAGVRDVIRNAYYDEDERMRVSAVFAMGRSADRYWRSIVLAELKSELPEMRFEAARACGELELRDSVPMLAVLAEDEDTEVRQAAIWALGRIGGREARRILLKYLDSEEEAIRDAAEAAMEELAFGEDALSIPVYGLDVEEDEDDLEFWDALDNDQDS